MTRVPLLQRACNCGGAGGECSCSEKAYPPADEPGALMASPAPGQAVASGPEARDRNPAGRR
jgi:hypothetical protein